jgi:bifunctional UDP-N-acetylglucosamine pyrophosphorylase/glucosamine-1-phosphate N-acetyltransferase
VIGHGAEDVRREMARDPAGAGLEYALQAEQKGTGHALAQARVAVPEAATLLVLSGDVPLVRPATLSALAARVGDGAWGALAVAELADPGSLGRVIARPRAGGGEELERIVEAADAAPAELALRRINAGLYALPAPEVFAYLDRLDDDNAQGELYLTDALGAAAADGRSIALHGLADPAEALGVNTREELAAVDRLLRRRDRDEED